jgi:hypothetical protein
VSRFSVRVHWAAASTSNRSSVIACTSRLLLGGGEKPLIFGTKKFKLCPPLVGEPLETVVMEELLRERQPVSRSCACIGSPCLRHRGHGASTGGVGGGGSRHGRRQRPEDVGRGWWGGLDRGDCVRALHPHRPRGAAAVRHAVLSWRSTDTRAHPPAPFARAWLTKTPRPTDKHAPTAVLRGLAAAAGERGMEVVGGLLAAEAAAGQKLGGCLA